MSVAVRRAVVEFLIEARAQERRTITAETVYAFARALWGSLSAQRRALERDLRAQGWTTEVREAHALSTAQWNPVLVRAFLGATQDQRAAFYKYGARALRSGAFRLSTDIGVGVSFDLDDPRAAQYLRVHGAELVTRISATSRERAGALLTRGVEEGWSVQHLASELRADFGFSWKRSLMIARTETANAFAQGTLDGAHKLEDAGIRIEKQWLVNEPEDDDCIDNGDSEWIDIDDAFPSGHHRPPVHPNCECDLVFRTAEGPPRVDKRSVEVPLIPDIPDAAFAAQAEQFDKKGPAGISYFKGEMGADKHVDVLLYRTDKGQLVGILYHYPFDFGDLEKKGNVNTLVHPKYRRQGIGTALLNDAIDRWKVDLTKQQYTRAGAGLANAILSKREFARLGSVVPVDTDAAAPAERILPPLPKAGDPDELPKLNERLRARDVWSLANGVKGPRGEANWEFPDRQVMILRTDSPAFVATGWSKSDIANELNQRGWVARIYKDLIVVTGHKYGTDGMYHPDLAALFSLLNKRREGSQVRWEIFRAAGYDRKHERELERARKKVMVKTGPRVLRPKTTDIPVATPAIPPALDTRPKLPPLPKEGSPQEATALRLRISVRDLNALAVPAVPLGQPHAKAYAFADRKVMILRRNDPVIAAYGPVVLRATESDVVNAFVKAVKKDGYSVEYIGDALIVVPAKYVGDPLVAEIIMRIQDRRGAPITSTIYSIAGYEAEHIAEIVRLRNLTPAAKPPAGLPPRGQTPFVPAAQIPVTTRVATEKMPSLDAKPTREFADAYGLASRATVISPPPEIKTRLDIWKWAKDKFPKLQRAPDFAKLTTLDTMKPTIAEFDRLRQAFPKAAQQIVAFDSEYMGGMLPIPMGVTNLFGVLDVNGFGLGEVAHTGRLDYTNGTQALAFNPIEYDNPVHYITQGLNMIRKQETPPGTGHPASTMTHEFGHVLYNYLALIGTQPDKILPNGWTTRDFVNAYMRDHLGPGARRLISGYATANEREAWAEAFSSLSWTPTEQLTPAALAMRDMLKQLDEWGVL